MPQNTLRIVAILEAADGKRDQLEAVLQSMPEARPATPVGCVRSAVGPGARRRTRSRCGFISERAQRSKWAHAARTQRARRFAAPGREDSSVNVGTATPPSLLRTRNRRSPRAVPRGLPAGPLEPSRGDDGCLSYELYEDSRSAGTFVFIEEWRDKDAAKAHGAQAHMAEAGRKLEGLLAGRPDIRYLSHLG